jgi:hypothetical protein
VSDHPVATLTTVQNDWRHPHGDALTWLGSVAVPPGAPRSMQLLTTDPEGERGPGRHLALFESATDVDATVAAWSGTGTPGSSPLPPYTTIFGVEGSTPPADVPAADSWVAHWRHLLTVGR